MTGDMSSPFEVSLSDRADDALREILSATDEGAPLVIVASPPGAGKTFSIEVLAAQQAGLRGEAIAVATTTRAQALALVERLANWSGFTTVLFVPKSQKVTPPPGVVVARSAKDIPEENAVVVSTAAKWAHTSGITFSTLIVDEAWQLQYATFAAMTSLSRQFVLVGDPGQIAPVVRVDVSRWQDDPSGPQVPAPVALTAMEIAGTVRVALPATRRLPADTASIVSSTFYADMPFGSLAGPRRLRGGWADELDGSLHIAEIGEPFVGKDDPLLSAKAAHMAQGILAAGEIETADGVRRVEGKDIGIVCSYVRQVPQVQAVLGPELGDVFVETANRWQGLERDVIIVIHPLSGQAEPSNFDMEAGRLCVMTSRHQAMCVLIGRPGLVEAASSSKGAAERHFGDTYDPARIGWAAHSRLLHEVGVSRGQL